MILQRKSNIIIYTYKYISNNLNVIFLTKMILKEQNYIKANKMNKLVNLIEIFMILREKN